MTRPAARAIEDKAGPFNGRLADLHRPPGAGRQVRKQPVSPGLCPHLVGLRRHHAAGRASVPGRSSENTAVLEVQRRTPSMSSNSSSPAYVRTLSSSVHLPPRMEMGRSPGCAWELLESGAFRSRNIVAEQERPNHGLSFGTDETDRRGVPERPDASLDALWSIRIFRGSNPSSVAPNASVATGSVPATTT